MANCDDEDDQWVVRMIEAVQEQRVLWDEDNDNHGNKNEIKRSWEAVERKLKFSYGIDKKRETLRKKWKSMSEYFNKSQTGSRVRLSKNFKYIPLLSFLKRECASERYEDGRGDVNSGEEACSMETDDANSKAMKQAFNELYPRLDVESMDARCKELESQFINTKAEENFFEEEWRNIQDEQEMVYNDTTQKGNLSSQKCRINKTYLQPAKLMIANILLEWKYLQVMIKLAKRGQTPRLANSSEQHQRDEQAHRQTVSLAMAVDPTLHPDFHSSPEWVNELSHDNGRTIEQRHCDIEQQAVALQFQQEAPAAHQLGEDSGDTAVLVGSLFPTLSSVASLMEDTVRCNQWGNQWNGVLRPSPSAEDNGNKFH